MTVSNTWACTLHPEGHGRNVRRQGKPADNLQEELVKALRRFNLIRIEPYEIAYLRIHPTEGTEKNIWKKTAAEA